MKKIAFLSFVIFSITHISAQSWCPSGTKWNFDYLNFGIEGYTEVLYTGDTIINSQNCKKLKKHLYAYNFIWSQPVSVALGTEYSYEDSGVVYFLNENNDWDTLFNFNASLGDSWKIPKQPYISSSYCDSNGLITVLDTGTIQINSELLKFKVVSFDFGQQAGTQQDTLVEKIGYLNTYLFPYDACEAALDGNEGGPLRCYYDDLFGTYQRFWFTNVCDYVGLSELELNTERKVLRIIDLMGRETEFKPNTPLIIIYDDGSHERIFKVDN